MQNFNKQKPQLLLHQPNKRSLHMGKVLKF